MVTRNGKHGPFIGCSAFPKCKTGGTYSVIRHDCELSDNDMWELDRI